MIKLIENLRSKPEPVRKQVVVWTAGLLTVFIFFIWLTRLTPQTVTVPEAQAVVAAEQTPGPLSVFVGFISADLEQVGHGARIIYDRIR